jgi:hypothetical protein
MSSMAFQQRRLVSGSAMGCHIRVRPIVSRKMGRGGDAAPAVAPTQQKIEGQLWVQVSQSEMQVPSEQPTKRV